MFLIMEERILNTLKSYLEINREALTEEETKDLKEQITYICKLINKNNMT